MPIFDIEEPEQLRVLREVSPHTTWNQLKSDTDVNHAVKVSTLKKTGGLCVYCEHKLITKYDYQIEHYYPKKGNDTFEYGDGIPNRAIQWENLFPGCLGGTAQVNNFEQQEEIKSRTGANKRNKNKLTCGQRKGETEPEGVFIHPNRFDNTRSFFLYNEADGSISINEKECRMQEIDVKLVRSHIERLNLESPRLQFARLGLSDSLRTEFNKALEFSPDYVDELIDSWLTLNEDGLYEHPFISLIISKYRI